MMETAYKLHYNPALDGLRGVAILLVILSHAHAPLFDGAFFGVDLFFVLSGFLITSLLLMEFRSQGRIDYWRFYRRRFFRLMPALALFLGVYCIAAPFIWPDLTDIYSDALVSILYLADYGIAFFDSPDTLLHMWSLSVEEHFYLIWPPLLVLLLRKSAAMRGRIWLPLLALWVLSTLWRAFWVGQGQQFYEIFFRFDTRASGLVAGGLLAALMVEKPQWIERLKSQRAYSMWFVLAVPLIMELGWDNQHAMLWGITVVEVAAIVILLSVQKPAGLVYEMLTAPALVKLGRLSYGVYLWHYPVVRYLRAEYSWPVAVIGGVLISTALAALSFYTVERWALRYRDGRQTGRMPARSGMARQEPALREATQNS
ncbi:acyltransferase family protein [Comamonas terrae]|uniref:Acyltransferase family protein n=1 Tax=Comamonas terrae TaxID=673548 RepID=A0ABW5UKL5_9BURK